MSIPIGFDKELRNLVDHTLVLHLEGISTAKVDIRALLNVNALDTNLEFNANPEDPIATTVHTCEVPVSRIRELNTLRLLVRSNTTDAVFKFKRFEIALKKRTE